MSPLAPALAVSVLSMCLFHALPGTAAENRPRSDCGTKPADIVFLLDSSSTVGPNNFNKVKQFMKDFVRAFEIGPKQVNIGVVTFQTGVHNQFWLSDYTSKSSLLDAIDKINYQGGTTRTDLGLSYVRQHSFTKAHGDRDNTVNILIVVTDGDSTLKYETEVEVLELRKTDIHVVAIGVGDVLTPSELENIAGGNESVFTVDNFDVLDSLQNELQQTTCEVTNIVDCGTKPADIVFLLDSSYTVGPDNFEKVKQFMKEFVRAFDIGPKQVNIGVVTFQTGVHNQFWLSDYTSKSSLLDAIDKINYQGGSTRTDLGLCYVRQHAYTEAHGDRDNAVNILIVVTDGDSTRKFETGVEVLELRKTDIHVVAIGVGDELMQSELEVIAGGEENVFTVDNFEVLDSLQNELQQTTCEVTEIVECGTLAGDIVFLLDSSSSVGDVNFEEVKDFVKNMAKSFNIGPDEVNIGVVTFSTQVHNEFSLNTYTSESSLVDAIDRIPYYGVTTMTDRALAYAREEAFSKANGDRDDAPNIVILITDGESDHPDKTHEEAEKLHKSDVTVLVIGVGDFVNESELEKIANGEKNVFDVTDFAALDTVKGKLKKSACKVIAATSSGSRRAIAATQPSALTDKE